MIDTLLHKLRLLWVKRYQEVNSEHQRALPFGDYIVNRWEKAKVLGCGEGTSIYDSVHIFGNVEIGKDTWIGPFVILDGSGGLTIGSHCSISAGVQIYSHDSIQWAISGDSSEYEYAETVIGDNCYIGPNAIITKGVSIGDRCIIGANSLVLNNVPSGSKAFGTPCRPVSLGNFQC